MKKKNKFPPGLNEKRVKEIIEYYDSQTDAESAREIETAIDETDTQVIVPKELLPKIKRLIAQYRKKRVG